MPKPDDTLWKLEQHSRAKHVILRTYLDAWLPIMSKYNRRLVLVDGFAGPGRYKGGERGSPLIMLDAFLEHEYRDRINAELVYLFIDERADRVEHLEKEIAALSLPDQLRVQTVRGAFEDVFRETLGSLQEAGQELAPAFAFIDPFGYSDAPMDLTEQFLGFERCEVLIYMPLPFVYRFVGRTGQEHAMTSLFGTHEWQRARGLDGEARRRFLHDLFREQLHERAGVQHVRSFEVGAGGNRGYHLFFGTNHPLGLDRMKSAMWKADPASGSGFQDSTDSDQPVLFQPEVDTAPLLDALRRRFGGRPFTIEDAERFTLVDTPFLPKSHLKGLTLAPAEEAEQLVVLTPRKKRKTYPSGTTLQLT